MPDTLRPISAAAAEQPADRDATIESLLVAGLDRYFAGEYERAIHAWTRVLFLDRGHARARAYIERARKVLAEHQRQGDLLLHAALEAFDAGELARARALLDEAVGSGIQDAQALTLRDRLERLHVGAAPVPGGAVAAAAVAPRPAAVASRAAQRALWPLIGLGLAALAVAAAWPQVVRWATVERAPARPMASAPAEPALPVPRASDLTLDRARGLYARGHLHEAAVALEGIRLDDPRRADADRLLAEIQRVLLAGAAAPVTAGPAR